MVWLYLAGGVVILYFVIKGMMSRGDPTEPYTLKPRVYENLRTGKRFDIQLDYNSPESVIRVDEEGREYVLRQGAMMDRGPKKIYLSKDNYIALDHDGWYTLKDEINVISDFQQRRIDYLEAENTQLKNNLSFQTARAVELELKFEERFGKLIDTQKRLKEASFFPTGGKK